MTKPSFIMKRSEDAFVGINTYSIFDENAVEIETFKATGREAITRAKNERLTAISYARLRQLQQWAQANA